MLKPLKGTDPGLEANLESFFTQDYPGVEFIFSVADANDPATLVVRRLIERYPHVNARLLVHSANVGPNPKVNNLVGGYAAAANDLILVSDSNVRVPARYLRRVVETLDDPGVGIVTAAITAQAPEGLGGKLEAVYLNTFFARWMVAAGAMGFPTVLGKSMLFRRTTAERFGGIKNLARYLAEDYMAGVAMLLLGLKVKVMREPIPQVIGSQSFKGFWMRHLRWGRMRKSQQPLALFGEPFSGPVLSGLLLATGLKTAFHLSLLKIFGAHLTLWFVADLLLMLRIGTEVTVWLPFLWLARELLAIPLWLHVLSGNTVDWRGNQLRLEAGGVLAESLSVAAVAAGLLAATLVGASSQALAATNAEEILKKSTQNIYSQSEESTYVMRLVETDGKETQRKMRLWFKRGGPDSAKLLIKFQEPADLRGTGLLSILDKDKPADQWMYLPALKKTRRIKGGNENESFLGSDFTVGDLTSIDEDAKRYAYAMTDETSGDCYVITGSPRAGVDAKSLPYSKKVLEVRKDNLMTRKVSFFNQDGQLQKVMELKKIHKNGQGWVADQMEMKDLLSSHSTILEVRNRDEKAPSDSMFTQSALERN